MKTKSIVAVALSCLVLLTTTSFAQMVGDSSAIYDETLWNMKKKRLVVENMDLTEADKSSFWHLYEDYSRAISGIESENLQIIMACADKSLGLDQRDLEVYSKRLLQNDLLLDRLRIQYYKKFSRALSPDLASRFMQLDDNIRMMVRFDVQNKMDSANEAQASIR
jgi:hypothetical protein